MSRFPTYAAEEALRARGVDTVPLHGTPAPELPGHVVEAVARTLSAPMRTRTGRRAASGASTADLRSSSRMRARREGVDAAPVLTAGNRALLAKTILERCDALDQVEDGVVENAHRAAELHVAGRPRRAFEVIT